MVSRIAVNYGEYVTERAWSVRVFDMVSVITGTMEPIAISSFIGSLKING